MNKGKLMIFGGAGKPLKKTVREIPPLLAGELLIQNLYTTLCGSDIHTYSGVRKEPCPTVLGHEIVGKIVQISDGAVSTDLNGQALALGDVITWSVYASRPDDYYHPGGIPQKADGIYKYGHRQITEEAYFHGGLAEYCILQPHTAILKVPERMPLPIAATINCAIATVAGAIRLAKEQGSLSGKNILISGMGLLGITCAAMCKEEQADCVIATDISAERLSKATAFGIDETILLSEESMEESRAYIHGKFPRKGADVVFDMSGSPEAMEFGLKSTAAGGVLIWVGAVFKQRDLHISAEWVIRNMLRIKGLHNYNFEDFGYAMQFMGRHWDTYPFEQVVGKEFMLEEANEAFSYALEHKPFRVGVKINHDN